MRVVVADATPLHYLILIDSADVLPRVFTKIHISTEELTCQVNSNWRRQ